MSSSSYSIFELLTLLLLPALAMLAGIALIVMGVRGKCVDDHPLCRRCGFDLTGRPETSRVCAECGSDLTIHRAIRIGHRKRRPGLIWAGVVPVVIALASAVVIVRTRASDFEFNRIKPTWWVMREARGNARGFTEALRELTRRVAEGAMSDAQVSEMTEWALAMQADPSKPWLTPRGDFVEAARRANRLSDVQWERYVRQGPQFSLRVRPRIRQGDDLPAEIRLMPGRVGARNPWAIQVSEPRAVGELTRPNPLVRGTRAMNIAFGGSFQQTLTLDRKATLAAAPGMKDIRVELSVQIFSEFGARPAQLREWTQTLPATFELVPPDAATVELVDDPSLRASLETMLKPNALIAIEPGGRHPQGYARVDLPGGTPGIPLAYAIFFRAGGHEKRLSSITFDAGANRPNSAGGLPGEALPERVDLIFRPDPDVARETVDIARIWNGEVVVRDVPVQHQVSEK